MDKQRLASLIDHTLLKADAREEQIVRLCHEAKEHGFASVCINPAWAPTAAKLLHGTAVKVCTVVGFPLGASTTAVKAAETRDAVANGAAEIDMVINIGWMKDGRYADVQEDIAAVFRVAAEKPGVLVKVIIETAYLSDDEIETACRLAKDAGAHFVKTSTGFAPKGATVEDVALMRRIVGPEMGVKASGGIRTYEDALRMVEAGADRIGASSGVAIVS